MKYFLILLCISLSSCAYQKTVKHEKEHRAFLSLVESKKKNLSKDEYRKFLTRTLKLKESEKGTLDGHMESLKNRISHSEVMFSSSAEEAHLFNEKTTSLEMEKLDKRIKLVEREIFFLRSQLSALEENK